MAHDHAHHGHAHGHAHGGAVDRTASRRRMIAALAVLALYMVAEVVGGLLTNSLALLADAGHMLSDVVALGLSVFAMWVASRPPTPERTYGYYRAEILAALVNASTLAVLSVFIFYEAYQRFQNPPEVEGPLMMGVAVGGLVVNLICLRLLGHGHGESLNVRGAWLHVLGDTLGSAGVIVSGVLIWTLGWNWTDPLASALIAALILVSSWSLLKETVAVLMEGTPGHLDVNEIRDVIRDVPGVRGVHDLHVWTITSGLVSLSCHVVREEGRRHRELLADVRAAVHDSFGIDHMTVQIEPDAFDECPPCR